jgi:hypothetical protein
VLDGVPEAGVVWATARLGPAGVPSDPTAGDGWAGVVGCAAPVASADGVVAGAEDALAGVGADTDQAGGELVGAGAVGCAP